MLRTLALLAALAACNNDAAPTACGRTDGLHVSVDVSSTACELISPDGANWSIDVGVGSNASLDKTTATVTDSGAPRHIDYEWAWPTNAQDGFEGQITWFGDGDGATIGHASTTYTVDLASCETVALTATCHFGVDAGP